MSNVVNIDGVQVEVVGRNDELSRMGELIDLKRGFQLIGPPGVGKTVLLQWARQRAATIQHSRFAELHFGGPMQSASADPWMNVDAQFGFDSSWSSTTDFYRHLRDTGESLFLLADDLELWFEGQIDSYRFERVFAETLKVGVILLSASRSPVVQLARDSLLTSQFSRIPVINVGGLDNQASAAMLLGLSAGQMPAPFTSYTASASGGLPGVMLEFWQAWQTNQDGPMEEAASEGYRRALKKYPWLKRGSS